MALHSSSTAMRAAPYANGGDCRTDAYTSPDRRAPVPGGTRTARASGARAAIAATDPDVLLVDTNAYGAAVAAERSGRPWATLLPSLLVLPGRGIPPYGLGMRPMRRPAGRLRDAVVSHGGMGIVQKAMAAGVPMVAVPFGRDQPEVARRVAESGAGVALPPKRLTPERLRAAVREAIALRPRAREAGRRLREAGGAERLASAVEELAGVRAPAAVAA
jgi:predicted glycosyltransferase